MLPFAGARSEIWTGESLYSHSARGCRHAGVYFFRSRRLRVHPPPGHPERRSAVRVGFVRVLRFGLLALGVRPPPASHDDELSGRPQNMAVRSYLSDLAPGGRLYSRADACGRRGHSVAAFHAVAPHLPGTRRARGCFAAGHRRYVPAHFLLRLGAGCATASSTHGRGIAPGCLRPGPAPPSPGGRLLPFRLGALG